MHSKITLLLKWNESYEKVITKEAWERNAADIEKILDRMREVHIVRCACGDIMFEEVYEDALWRLAEKALILKAVCPNACASCREALEREAEKAIMEPFGTEEAEILLEAQIRLLDIAGVLK